MKKVVVTGAAGGMGEAICWLLGQRGYQVYGLDRKKEIQVGYQQGDANLGGGASELPADYLHPIYCDITKEESVEEAFCQVKEQSGTIDAIIHTAGIYDLDSLLEMGEERFCQIFDINLFGVYRVNKTFVPLLKKGGRIIITTSELAPLDPLPFTGVYAITKAALERYAFSLRMEVNLLGISVSVIRPGAVKTGLLGDSTQALDSFVEHTCLYQCNAAKFKEIVDSVEAKSIHPEVIAETVWKVLNARHPKFVYNRNRNGMLRLLNVLPDRLQVWIIKQILTKK